MTTLIFAFAIDLNRLKIMRRRSKIKNTPTHDQLTGLEIMRRQKNQTIKYEAKLSFVLFSGLKNNYNRFPKSLDRIED